MKPYPKLQIFWIACLLAALGLPSGAADGRGDRGRHLKANAARSAGPEASRAIITGPSSQFIEVAIRDNGQYTMGVPGGPILLYGHPSPWSSYATIRVDGADYHNYDGALFGETVSPPTNMGNSNEGSWALGTSQLRVKQTVTLVTGTSTGKQDTYLLQYQVVNQGTSSHVVGCRIMFDTDLNGNDGAPFQVPGTGAVTTETQFEANQIPGYFFVVNDLATPDVTCQGTLIGGLVHPSPHRFQIADWGNIVDVPFDYAVQPDQYITDDSAYAAYWFDQTLQPGQSITFSTYYGLGGIGVDPTPPLVTALTAPQFLECVDNQLSPNPFQVTLLLSNTLPDASQTVTGIQATLTVPQGLTLESPATAAAPDLAMGASSLVSWSVRATGAPVGQLDYSIAVTTDNAGAKTVPGSVSVPQGCNATTGGLTGTVRIGNGTYAGLLDGPGVLTLVANLRNASGSLTVYPLAGPQFTLENLTPGSYELSIAVVYRDNIRFDAQLGPAGCPHPAQLYINKSVLSAPVQVDVVAGTNRNQDVLFPPPLVFLHGASECYSYWYTPDRMTTWDNAARSAGFFSFTPNFDWLSPSFTWSRAADQVADQVLDDLRGLHRQPTSLTTTTGILPWRLVTHDMGGLVARVLSVGNHRSDPFMDRLGQIFLIGTPNSGSDMLLGAGDQSPLSQNSVMRRFNEVYPDFGARDGLVTAIAGTAGWWASDRADGPLSLNSAFHITRLACSQSGNNASCTPYAHHAFRGNNALSFAYSHYQLGAPASEVAILREVILDQVAALSQGEPESPAGSTMWGTGARTTGTTQGSVQSRTLSQDFPFTIGPTDGMAIGAWILAGSATFQILDPQGHPAEMRPAESYPGGVPFFLFLQLNPEPGDWKLRVQPGAGGAYIWATAVENSPFGITGYLGTSVCNPGQTVALRINREGSFDGVTPTAAKALIFNPDGTPLQTVTLSTSGQHWAGTLQAPGGAGSYPVTFELDGTYLGSPFTRTSYETLTVIGGSRTRLFGGSFSDSGLDRDGDGKFDALAFGAGVNPSPGITYTLAADLYDADGYWVARGSGSQMFQSTAPGEITVVFPMDTITCSQFSGPFQVRNLVASYGPTLEALDLWAEPVATQTWSSGDFDCGPGTPGPTLTAVLPDEGIRGQAYDLTLSGTNFPEGASVSLGPGVTISGTLPLGEGVLSVSASILADAAPGFRDITMTPPAGPPVVLPQAFEVKAASTPTVTFAYPAQGQTVEGEITVNASAWGDLPISRVDILVDGSVKVADPDFPYTLDLDTRTLTDGPHTLTAIATDASGNTATSIPLAITVRNSSVPGDCDGDGQVSIGEVQRAINMFLGLASPDCGVDCNGDGSVSIGEVQKVINNFLGIQSPC